MPARILDVPDIPRTISGKIVELAVRDIVHGQSVKNIDTPVRAYRVVFDASTAETETSDSEF